MIHIEDSSLCCGCTACVSVCPVRCIVMRRDVEGFDYPFPNIDRCIDCGKCEEVCPMTDSGSEGVSSRMVSERGGVGNVSANEGGRATYACRTEYEPESSSGGVFYALGRGVIESGGIVFGAAFQEDNEVGHIEVEDVDGLGRLCGSKYVQSDLYSTFEDAAEYLKSGRKVLFSGTPCQIAGLMSALDKEYDNLITVDCACHGVPPPGLWQKYLSSVSSSQGPVVKVNFRDKRKGWRDYRISFQLKDGRVVSREKLEDSYMALFLQNVSLRPSCYDCRFRSGNSCADITLGDLWNVSRVLPEMNDGRGVSIICANTDRGCMMLENTDLSLVRIPFDKAVEGNSGFQPQVSKPELREMFFAGLPYASDLQQYMRGFVRREPVCKALWRKSHSFLSRIRRRLPGND